MDRQERARVDLLVKDMLGSAAKNSPVSLDLLNSVLLLCLGAYIILTRRELHQEQSDVPWQYRYWLGLADTQDGIYLRDMVYDLIFPAAPKEIRQAVDQLGEREIAPIKIKALIRALYAPHPDIETIRAIVEYLISSYYPLVIMEQVDTPRSVNRLCMAILNPLNGTFYDGTAGIGSTCLEAGKYAKKNNGKLRIYAREKLDVLCAISTIRAYIHDVKDITIRSGDIFAAAADTDEKDLNRFDYSVMFPPLGQPLEEVFDPVFYSDPDFAGMGAKSNTEWFFIKHQLSRLREDSGRGIIAVSTGTLFNTAYCRIRQKMISSGFMECIITLPSHILPYTTSPLSLIVFNKKLSYTPDEDILMIQTERMFSSTSAARVADQLDEKMIAEIVRLVDGREGSRFSRRVSLEEIKNNHDILLPSRYVVDFQIDSEFGTFLVHSGAMRDWPLLGDVAKRIYRGVNGSRLSSQEPGGQYKIINYADIQEGKLQTQQLKTYAVTGKVGSYLVQPGDLLISCKGVQIKTCVVPAGVENTLLSLNFIGVRLEMANYCPEFLYQYLNSPIGMAYLKGRQVGTSIITLKNDDLKQMPVPPISLDHQRKCISDFTSIEYEIEAKIQQLYHGLRQAKWELYQEMGLNDMLARKDER